MKKKSKRSKKASDKEYSTGYARPPMHTRWKQGESGNPNALRRTSRRTPIRARLSRAEGSTSDVYSLHLALKQKINHGLYSQF